MLTNSKYALVSMFSLVSLSAMAADVPATNCELFIDKLQITMSSHSLTTLNVFIKIKEDLVDGAVTRVGVLHSRQENRTDRDTDSFLDRIETLPAFVGSRDYFQFTTVLGHDWMSAQEYVVFFLDTNRGTRYWLNARNWSGAKFLFSDKTDDLLYRHPSGHYRSDAVRFSSWNVAEVQQTSDYPADLAEVFNPRRCR